MLKIQCACPVCGRTEKVTKLIFIPCHTNQVQISPFYVAKDKDLQVEMHLKCGHVVICQLKVVPIGS